MTKKQCKYCSRTNATNERISGCEHYVICPDCGTCTKRYPTLGLALEAWNNDVVTHISEIEKPTKPTKKKNPPLSVVPHA